MSSQRSSYVALVAALREEFGFGAREALWINMRKFRYDRSSLGVLAQAVHDADDVAFQTGRQVPMVVAICGSTRFRAEMTVANRELTLAGYIVLAPGVFAHDGDEMTERQKVALDDLHLRKIDLADLIYVVNPGGYIGDSTRREIAYAQAAGKSVRFLVDQEGGEGCA